MADGGDRALTFPERMKYCFVAHWRGLVILLFPVVFLFVLFPTSSKKRVVAYTLCVMASYWVTECIPLPVTSFLPLVTFPIFEVVNSFDACTFYMNNTTVLFIMSLILASAVEQSGLHIRIALLAIRSIGVSHYRLLFAINFTTMFVSMWITNTAATVMMVPILFALLRVFEEHNLLTIYNETKDGGKIASDIACCYFCSATYSATIGGIGTLVGTGTNITGKGIFEDKFKAPTEYLSFPLFSAFTVPYMLVMESVLYLCMTLQFFGFLRPNSAQAQKVKISPAALEAAKAEVDSNWKALGPLSSWEIMVMILFGGGMMSFFLRSPKVFDGFGDLLVNYYQHDKLIQDSFTGAIICFLMFLLPQKCIFFKNFTAKILKTVYILSLFKCPITIAKEDLPKTRAESVIRWKQMNANLPYSFTFLLEFLEDVDDWLPSSDILERAVIECGGFALSTAANEKNSNLNATIGSAITDLTKNLPNEIIILMLIIVSVFITNFASNVAICNVITPVAAILATMLKQNPLSYVVATVLSCSYCFMIPVGTPGNLVVQSLCHVSTGQMIRAGALTTVFVILITWLACLYWAPVVWPVMHEKTPSWAVITTTPKPA